LRPSEAVESIEKVRAFDLLPSSEACFDPGFFRGLWYLFVLVLPRGLVGPVRIVLVPSLVIPILVLTYLDLSGLGLSSLGALILPLLGNSLLTLYLSLTSTLEPSVRSVTSLGPRLKILLWEWGLIESPFLPALRLDR
jgi:hypothetical protein